MNGVGCGNKNPDKDRTAVEMPMAKYRVSNISNTTERAALPAGYSSWIDFWEKKTGLSAGLCRCTSCFEKAIDGAHVYVEGHGTSWYIVPLCRSHNHVQGTFEVNGPLVPVNPANTILW